jgi:hypothetical protein
LARPPGASEVKRPAARQFIIVSKFPEWTMAEIRVENLRTEHLTIAKSSNGRADGAVDWIEHLGDQTHFCT